MLHQIAYLSLRWDPRFVDYTFLETPKNSFYNLVLEKKIVDLKDKLCFLVEIPLSNSSALFMVNEILTDVAINSSMSQL